MLAPLEPVQHKSNSGVSALAFPPFLHSPSLTTIEYKIVYKSTVILDYNIIVIYFMKLRHIL